METRPLGDTGQRSSILTFGALALDALGPDAATEAVHAVLDRGVNHVDVAPTYGSAESKLAPALGERREEVFLGCKTGERDYEGAQEKLAASLERLGTDYIDLYQFHGVTQHEEIDAITADGGALEAYREAREEGVVDHIGLTSHGRPEVIREAVDRIPDIETVMFPVNPTIAAKEGPDHEFRSLASDLREEGIGVIAIKAFTKAPWPEDMPEDERPYETWYEPYDDPEQIQRCLHYTLSQDVTTLTNPGDPRLVDPVLDAAEGFEPMSDDEQAALVAERRDADSPVPTGLS